MGSDDYSTPWQLAQQHSVFDAAKAERWGLDGAIDPANASASRTLQGVTLTATELRNKQQTLDVYRATDKRFPPPVDDNGFPEDGAMARV